MTTETASDLQRPIKRGAMDAEQACHLGDRAAVLVDELAGERDLARIKGWARSEADAARLGGDPPGPGALDDQRPLEIGDAVVGCALNRWATSAADF